MIVELLVAVYAVHDFVVRRTEGATFLTGRDAWGLVLLLGIPIALFESGPIYAFLLLLVARTLLRLGAHRLTRTRGPLLSVFAVEQLLGLALVIATARIWTWESWLSPVHQDHARGPLLGLAILAFQVGGGAFLVSWVLRRFELEASQVPAGTPGMGRTIGVLERLLAVLLILADAWSGLGLILAAKSIARFKDLEQRSFAEYYLIGSLTSFLVAICSGTFWLQLRG